MVATRAARLGGPAALMVSCVSTSENYLNQNQYLVDFLSDYEKCLGKDYFYTCMLATVVNKEFFALKQRP